MGVGHREDMLSQPVWLPRPHAALWEGHATVVGALGTPWVALWVWGGVRGHTVENVSLCLFILPGRLDNPSLGH